MTKGVGLAERGVQVLTEGESPDSCSLDNQKPLKCDIEATRHLPALPQRSELRVGESPRLAASIGSDGVKLVERRHDEKVSKVVFGLAVGADI